MTSYPILPMGKPRMTQRDKWKGRKVVLEYHAFKDECRIRKVRVPESNSHIIFIMPMPKRWSEKKKQEMDGKPHQQKPDKDNLEKALLDALFQDDAHIWDARVTKRWGREGQIIIHEFGEMPNEIQYPS